jgi:hypothetical protein
MSIFDLILYGPGGLHGTRWFWRWFWHLVVLVPLVGLGLLASVDSIRHGSLVFL